MSLKITQLNKKEYIGKECSVTFLNILSFIYN